MREVLMGLRSIEADLQKVWKRFADLNVKSANRSLVQQIQVVRRNLDGRLRALRDKKSAIFKTLNEVMEDMHPRTGSKITVQDHEITVGVKFLVIKKITGAKREASQTYPSDNFDAFSLREYYDPIFWDVCSKILDEIESFIATAGVDERVTEGAANMDRILRRLRNLVASFEKNT